MGNNLERNHLRLEHTRRRVGHLEGVVHRDEGHRRAVEDDPIAIRGERLEVGIRHVVVGGRGAPGDPLVLTDQEERQTGKAHAARMPTARAPRLRVHRRDIPDGRVRERQVGVVRQQRIAARRARPRHHPVVRPLDRGLQRRRHIAWLTQRARHHTPPGAIVGRLARPRQHERTAACRRIVGRDDRRVEAPRSHQLVGQVFAEAGDVVRDRQVVPPRVGQAVGQRDDRRDRVLRLPVRDVLLMHQPKAVLLREHRPVPARTHVGQPGIYAGGVGLEDRHRLRRGILKNRLLQVATVPRHEGDPVPLVDLDGRRTHKLRNPARRHTAAQVHLLKPVAGMEVAQAGCAVLVGRAEQVQHAERIEAGGQLARKPGDRDPFEGAAAIGVAAAAVAVQRVTAARTTRIRGIAAAARVGRALLLVVRTAHRQQRQRRNQTPLRHARHCKLLALRSSFIRTYRTCFATEANRPRNHR